MRKILAPLFLVLIVAAIIAAHMLLAFPEAQLLPIEAGKKWFPLLHLRTNAFFTWRTNPFFREGERLFAAHWSIVLSSITFVSSALFFLLRGSWREALFPALLFATIPALLFGDDRVLRETMCFFPLLCAALALFFAESDQPRGRLIRNGIVALVCAVIFARSANQYALFGAIAAVAACLNFRPAAATLRSAVGGVLLVLIPAIVVYCSVPAPKLPDYPPTAAVVPDDGVPGITRPLLGSAPSIPLVDRTVIRHEIAPLGLIVLLVCLIGLSRSSRSPHSRRLLGLAVLLNVILVLDTALPEALSEIAPLSAISRIVPALSWIPLHYAVFSIGVFFVLWAAVESGAIAGSIVLFVALMLPGLVRGELPGALSENRAAFAINDPSTQSVQAWRLIAPYLTPEVKTEIDAKVVSPSYKTISAFGFWSVDRLPWRPNLTTEKLRNAEISRIVSRDGTVDAHLLADRRPGSRWTSGKGRQDGTEWLAIELLAEHEFYGIELSTGDFTSDFPRGLRVTVPPQCPLPGAALVPDAREVISLNPWIGPLRFSPNGFPYFGNQSDVTVQFPQPVKTRCLVIEQTGSDPAFDWSVAQIRLLVPARQ